jgi:hypothetical protein
MLVLRKLPRYIIRKYPYQKGPQHYYYINQVDICIDISRDNEHISIWLKTYVIKIPIVSYRKEEYKYRIAFRLNKNTDKIFHITKDGDMIYETCTIRNGYAVDLCYSNYYNGIFHSLKKHLVPYKSGFEQVYYYTIYTNYALYTNYTMYTRYTNNSKYVIYTPYLAKIIKSDYCNMDLTYDNDSVSKIKLTLNMETKLYAIEN